MCSTFSAEPAQHYYHRRIQQRPCHDRSVAKNGCESSGSSLDLPYILQMSLHSTAVTTHLNITPGRGGSISKNCTNAPSELHACTLLMCRVSASPSRNMQSFTATLVSRTPPDESRSRLFRLQVLLVPTFQYFHLFIQACFQLSCLTTEQSHRHSNRHDGQFDAAKNDNKSRISEKERILVPHSDTGLSNQNGSLELPWNIEESQSHE